MPGEHGSAAFLLGGAGTITATAAALTAALVLTGGPGFEADPSSVTGEPVAEAASWTETPAALTLTKALAEAPGGWNANGGLQTGVSAPAPFSCPLPGIAPSVSYTQAYSVAGGRIQVTLQAYTAGLGAEAMVLQSANAPVCAGSGSGLYQSGIIEGGRGAEHEVAAVSRGGVRTQVSVFRSGDVLAFISGTGADTVSRAADALDAHLAPAMAQVCRDTGSKTDDGRRSPFSSSGYEPMRRPVEVAISPVEKPAAPRVKDETGAMTAVPRTEIPAPVIVEKPVERAEVPDYPVAPEMPAFMEFPNAPAAPAPKATTTTSVQVRADDAEGPGCGWKFTGMKAPAFNKDEASAEASKLMAEAETKLKDGAGKWQEQVRDYWISYEEYRSQAVQYQRYAKDVAKVNEAWERIGEQWADYRSKLKDYETRAAERQAFLDRQAAAEKSWQEDISRCERETKDAEKQAREATEAARETARKAAEEALKNAGEGTVPPPAPAEPEPVKPKTVEGCPAEKPSILSETAPEVPGKPSEPKRP